MQRGKDICWGGANRVRLSNETPDPHLDEGAGAAALPPSGRSELGAMTGGRWGGLACRRCVRGK